LTFKQVSHDAVVTLSVILEPLFGLFGHRELFDFYLAVLRLRRYFVQLVVHSVDQKSQKLLRILLPVPAELRNSAGDLIF